jgi:hypothetical protein
METLLIIFNLPEDDSTKASYVWILSFAFLALDKAKRGGRMVIINPIPEVQNIREVTGIPAIIPIYSHFESAEAVLMSS